MNGPVVHGVDIPGGVHVVQTAVLTSAAPLASDTRACASITLLANTGSGTVYWGFDDMLVGRPARGFITAGGAVSIPAPVSASSIFLYGTAGDTVYWSSTPGVG